MSYLQSFPKFAIKASVMVFAASGLAGCNSLGLGEKRLAADSSVYRPLSITPSAMHLSDLVPQDKLTTATRQLAKEGIKALDAREFLKASQLFNLALKTDISNSYLNFLNGLTYHLRALGGEGALYGLAQQGYEMAIQFDSSNVVARHYLGLLFLDRRNFAAARGQLMEAALYTRDDPDLLYDLAAAAYYAKDPRTAYAALEGLRRIEGDKISTRVLRASAIMAAAVGDDATARRFLTQLQAGGASEQEQRFTEDRVVTWKDTYEGGFIKAQFPTGGNFGTQGGGFPGPSGSSPYPGQPPGYGPQGGSPYGSQPQHGGTPPGQSGMQGGFFEKQMVNLDVVIVATEEDNTDTFGLNLLDGLRIQFGDSLGTPAWRKTVTRNQIDANTGTLTRDITRMIQIPGLTYSLNIANAQDLNNEVLARPSLVAMGGQTSTFFSGTDVIGAAVSTGQGGSVQVQKEAGVKLSVTPEFLPDNLIKLQVVAERTFLTNPNSNVLFDFRLDTSKTLVSANVAMKFGETLILSGLSERNLETNNSGVPLLRDVPLVQYLFSRQTKRDFHKSVLVLITPRRPAYTNRSNEDIEADKAKMSEFDRVQAEFEDKYKLWFKPVPSSAQVVKMLDASPIFREFRSGDITLDSWTSRASHGGRLKSALGFLYY